jgi:hypothetical protein
MKKLFVLFLLFSISISAQHFKRYDFKSGKIIYNSTGSMTGTETLYFDNYGMLEAKETNTELDVMGIKQKTNSKVIMKDKWVYSIDMANGVANKMENPVYAMFPEGGDIENLGKKMMEKMGGKKIGSERVKGKDCEIWEIEKMGSKIWIWKSIPIKTVINMMGMNITQIAESIEVDIDIPANMFELPEGIEIKDVTAPNLNGLMGN